MWIEGQQTGEAVGIVRGLHHPAHQRLMPAMYAVEVADGQKGALGQRRFGKAEVCLHGVRTLNANVKRDA